MSDNAWMILAIIFFMVVSTVLDAPNPKKYYGNGTIKYNQPKVPKKKE